MTNGVRNAVTDILMPVINILSNIKIIIYSEHSQASQQGI